MSDEPIRLRDSSMVPSLRDALASARTDVPDDARLRALESRILPVVAASIAAMSASTAGTAAGGAKAASVKTLLGLSIGKAVVVGTAVVAVALGSSAAAVRFAARPEPASSSTAVVLLPRVGTPLPATSDMPAAPIASAAEASASSTQGAPPVVAPSASASSRQKPATSPGHTQDPTEDLAGEAELLRGAQDALRTSPERTIQITDEHARRFPRGALAQERDVMAIEALVKLGRRREADARAARFERAYPNSTHSARVATLLGR